MPIRKYRNLEEMNRDRRWLPTGDPSIAQNIRYLWKFSELLLRPVGTCIPRGVRKYRSLDEANTDRSRWEEERIDRIRTERNRGE
jgi:hypothetical protein